MNFLLPALFMLLTFQAFGACHYGENLDLRKIHPAVFKALPIHNQGEFGYCYAYTGKFLYDFHHFLKNPTSSGVTSAAWAAALGMKSGKAFTDEGGFACNVVRGLSSHPKNCINSSLSNKSFHELGPELYRLLFDSDSLMMDYQGTTNPNWNLFPVLKESDFLTSTHLTGEKLKVRNGFLHFQHKVKQVLLQRGISQSHAGSAFQYYSLVREQHFKNTYTNLTSQFAVSIAEKSCDTWKTSHPVNCQEETPYDFVKIDEHLNKGHPVGISYCSKVLSDKTYRGFPQSTPSVECGMHASVIIGRKSDENGRCQYLLRNSWGADHGNYDWKTDRGDIWMDSDAISDNIREIQLVF